MPERGARASLLRWYDRHRRDLPWRRGHDPYAIWVSEIMLQQTQVATVVPYHERFLERFPDVRALAHAEEDDVLALWSGLGYYRRARALHAAAREVVERHGGHLPDDPELLRRLPGIGRYTAGAIASIAFGRAEPVLDGNVRRVLARTLALRDAPAGPAAFERRLWGEASGWADGPRPGDLNQALMELGATVCTPASPDCPRCPIRRHCRGRAAGDPESYPAPKRRPTAIGARVAVGLIERAGRVLLERPTQDGPLRGRWDLPAVEIAGDGPAVRALRRYLASRHGLDARVAPARAAVAAHAIMHRRLALEIHGGSLRRGRTAARGDLRWVDPARLDEVPVSGATRKALRLARGGGQSSSSSSKSSSGRSRTARAMRRAGW